MYYSVRHRDYTTRRENRQINHAWNKVKLDGKWYNMDVCWADTANASDYDLKTDAEYLALPNKHWPTYFGNGPYAVK